MIKQLIITFCLITLLNASVPPPSLPLNEEAFIAIERFIERHSISDVKGAYAFFIDLFSMPMNGSKLRDGTYEGETSFDDYQYKHRVSLEVHAGKVTGIFYDEVKEDGHGKRYDSAYCEEMKNGSGASPNQVYPAYENQFLKQQDLAKIDGITGTTYSLYRFRIAVLRALTSPPTKRKRSPLRD